MDISLVLQAQGKHYNTPPGPKANLDNCRVDIVSEWGELLLRIQTDFTVNNVQFAGPKLDELWLFGVGSISRVQWNMTGMPHARS